MGRMEIDLILLSRDLSPARADVWEGIQAQTDVDLRLHRLSGPALEGDPHRWASIVRARNQSRFLGTRRFVMLLDDDVVLGPGCLARLFRALNQRPDFAALAADTSGEMRRDWEHWDYPTHVGMAAVLFRRERLQTLTFRWEPGRCECLCCCADLRASGWGIGYLKGAAAEHRPSAAASARASPAIPLPQGGLSEARPRSRGGRILTAFDRRDAGRFRTFFLRTLREAGNDEPVWALAYGLYPSELSVLAAQPGVHVVPLPHGGTCPALRRLRDFQSVLKTWPEDTPVTYWDAGDVLFQGRIDPLWDLVSSRPGVLHVVAEPKSHPENPVIPYWCDFIRDPAARAHAYRVLTSQTFLNSGFAAGTATALLDYAREGDRLLHSDALAGVDVWGDQLALNLYCHANPSRWTPVSAAWNFTMAGRDPQEYQVQPDGRARRTDGAPVVVLHGNARSLRWLEVSPAMAAASRAAAGLSVLLPG